jgi:hypothetical protein
MANTLAARAGFVVLTNTAGPRHASMHVRRLRTCREGGEIERGLVASLERTNRQTETGTTCEHRTTYQPVHAAALCECRFAVSLTRKSSTQSMLQMSGMVISFLR